MLSIERKYDSELADISLNGRIFKNDVLVIA